MAVANDHYFAQQIKLKITKFTIQFGRPIRSSQ